MTRGIDCASRLTAETAAALRGMGYTFAGRYVVPQSGSTAWKALSKAEAEAIRAAGMDILCIFELDAARAGRGEAVGTQDGLLAQSCARALGVESGTTLYFAVDYYPAAAELPKIEAYLRAAGEQIAPYTLGVYGCYDVVEYLAAREVCAHYWQCVGWSGGKISKAADVYQATGNEALCGILVDRNECYREAGFWKSPGGGDASDKGGDASDGVTNNASGSNTSGTPSGGDASDGVTNNASGSNASGTPSGGNASDTPSSPAETELSGEEIYRRLQNYLSAQPLPAWAEAEYAEAISRGLTDGERPMLFAPRYQAAILALRALRASRGEEGKE